MNYLWNWGKIPEEKMKEILDKFEEVKKGDCDLGVVVDLVKKENIIPPGTSSCGNCLGEKLVDQLITLEWTKQESN
jgi:hypothetical protein